MPNRKQFDDIFPQGDAAAVDAQRGDDRKRSDSASSTVAVAATSLEELYSQKRRPSSGSTTTAAAATAAVPRAERRRVQTSTLDGSLAAKVSRALRDVARLRRDVATVGDDLSATEARVARLAAGALADVVADVERRTAELEVDAYMETVVDKLIRYGDSIRLVVYHLDGGDGYRRRQRHHPCPSDPSQAEEEEEDDAEVPDERTTRRRCGFVDRSEPPTSSSVDGNDGGKSTDSGATANSRRAALGRSPLPAGEYDDRDVGPTSSSTFTAGDDSPRRCMSDPLILR